jgi:hypothetical protein
MEADITEPGPFLIAPAVLGIAAPLGVFIADYAMNPMPRGLPSSLATGMLMGAGAGLGIWAVQHTTSSEEDEWDFQDFARAEFIGSTLGGALGGVAYAALRPSPKTNMLVLSAATWGTAIGGAFGGAASTGDWSESNDFVMVGGLVGYGVGALGSGGASMFWVPSWNQLGWMWGGFGIGVVASTPIYLFYLGSDGDPRTGLIGQGIGGLIGLGIGAFVGTPDGRGMAEADEERFDFAKVVSYGPTLIPGAPGFLPGMALPPGTGVGVNGLLW